MIFNDVKRVKKRIGIVLLRVILQAKQTLIMKCLFNIFTTLCFLFVLNSCSNASSKESLTNTEWKGMARIPDEQEIVLKFTSTKVDVIFQKRVIETMNYTFKDKKLHLEKTSGGSPCAIGSKGEYAAEILGDTFKVNLTSDDCASRIASLKDNIFYRTSATQ